MSRLPHFYRTPKWMAAPIVPQFCASQLEQALLEPSRVKAAAKHNNHAIPSVSIERGAERSGNMGYFDGDLAALLPQGDL